MFNEKKTNFVEISASLQSEFGGPSAVVMGSYPHLSRHYNHKLIIFGSSKLNSDNIVINSTFLNNRFGFRFKIPNKYSRRCLNKAEIILIHGYYLWSTLLALHYSKCKNIYLMPHGSLEQYQDKSGKIRKNLFSRIVKFLLKDRSIHFVLASDSEMVGVQVKFPNSKVSVLGLGVNYNKLDCSSSKLHDPINLFCISRISLEKRIDLCIKAMATLNLTSRRYLLNIYGSGNVALETELRSLVKSLNLEEVINFKGQVDGIEKIEAFKNSDIMLLPSENENFAVAVAESIAFGKPVVVSKFVAMHEFVDFHSTGLTIDDLDVTKLVSAIEEVTNKFSKFQESCISSAHLLDWENVIKRWFQVFDGSLRAKNE